ncbi:hypothetical protein, partial [Salmonella sp. s58078]|uniref:hypothetical protein n=1 Tax=Salmonella sp. s58078 TaxID=3159699 RepID=UPI0039815997
MQRKKRLGISLPYRATFFQLPSWRDWMHIEESLPHRSSAGEEDVQASPRFTGTRSFAPLSSPTTQLSGTPMPTS